MLEPAHYSAFETLRDGRPVEIRALRPDDRADLVAAVARSSAVSLYRRFFAVRRDIAGSITLIAGQIAFTTLCSPLIRAAIGLLFAVPAAIAGYHAALGLAHIGISAEGWRQVMAVMGAIAVAATAWARMVLSAPCPTPDKALPPA